MPHAATCHCGIARAEMGRLPDWVASCDCTCCPRAGGLRGYHGPEEVRVVAAPDRVHAPGGLDERNVAAPARG